MRRSDREITDRSEIDDILKRASICHLGLNDKGECYVVPVNYGYDGSCFYIHSAPEGRKIDILREDNRVSFTIYTDQVMKESYKACSFSMKYKSVMGRGLATLINDRAAKEEALNVIMRHYLKGSFSFDPARVDKIVIIKIEILSMSGKKSI
ncbi:MAG: pyridoxamine 5'-phosphate oxidase family protein [Dehalococcoidia bacterium]